VPNVLKLTVENPDEIRNAGAYDTDALMRVQSSATETGTFADLTGTGSTPTVAVVAATRSYTAYDPNGTSSTWYRTRFENAAGTRLSDWSAAFQAGDETAGLLCGVDDVWQAVGTGSPSANDAELIIDNIRQVSRQIENYCGRWFAPRPLSGTTTYRFHTESGYSLWIPRGIRSITTLGIGAEDQPDSGGTYTTATATDFYIDPPVVQRTDPANDPGFWVRLRSQAATYFVDATFGAQITGAFGYARVPDDVQGVTTRAAIRKYIGKGGAVTAVGPNGTELLLPDMAGSDRTVLDWYKRRV